MTTITVCMGSSCYSKGNSQNAEIIQRFIKNNNLTDTVVVKGSLCSEQCKLGPNIKINDKFFSNVLPETIEGLLERELGINK
ncbi:MAG: NADH dehydrogenase [Treponema sp. CETP13]|nr:MAG: NADH dehydrogenase [Treponema sp. CETP13]